MEAMRCLQRRLSDLVHRTMLGDYTPHRPFGQATSRTRQPKATTTLPQAS